MNLILWKVVKKAMWLNLNEIVDVIDKNGTFLETLLLIREVVWGEKKGFRQAGISQVKKVLFTSFSWKITEFLHLIDTGCVRWSGKPLGSLCSGILEEMMKNCALQPPDFKKTEIYLTKTMRKCHDFRLMSNLTSVCVCSDRVHKETVWQTQQEKQLFCVKISKTSPHLQSHTPYTRNICNQTSAFGTSGVLLLRHISINTEKSAHTLGIDDRVWKGLEKKKWVSEQSSVEGRDDDEARV